MGHALDETLQDILIRWRRMQGYSALWLPGTDHASIATEAKIVEAMREEGVSKDDIGRDGFLERAWEWKRVYLMRLFDDLLMLATGRLKASPMKMFMVKNCRAMSMARSWARVSMA